MATTVWAAPLPLLEKLFTQPEAIGPFVDLQAAKLAGEAPYVIRDAVTGNIFDRIRNDVYPGSEDFARCGGHQSYIDVPQTEIKGRFTGCWKCGKIYDLAAMRSYASAAAFASEHGYALDPDRIRVDTTKGCTHELARDRRPGDCWRPAKISQREVAAAFDAFKADDTAEGELTEMVRAFLLQHVSDDAAEDYLLAEPPAQSFRKNGNAFASALKRDCLSYLSANGRTDFTPVALPLGAERRQKVKRLADLQDQYSFASAADRIALEQPLQVAVLQFATRTAHALMCGDKKETAIAPDDVAQESAIKLLLGDVPLASMSGTVISEAVKAERKRTKDLASEKRSRSSLDLFLESEEDGSLEDNPWIHRKKESWENTPQIPEWVQGTDRTIVELVNDGYEYPAIAKMLGLSVDALAQRVSRLKKRAKEQGK